MKEKKIIQRNLPLDTKYQFVSLTRGSIESGQVCACYNCGQLITNIVTIINEKREEFMIGTDCSETLLKASRITMLRYSDYDSEMFTLRQVNRFMTLANKMENKVTSSEHYYQIEHVDKKGKTKFVLEFKTTVDRFYPQFKERFK